MALNIIDKPYEVSRYNYAPAHNEVIWVSSGTNNTQQSYRSVYTLQNDRNGSTIAVIKKSVIPTGYGVLDIHRIAESLISYDIDIADSGFQDCPNMFVPIKVLFGEEYGSPLTSSSAITNGTVKVWNAGIKYRDFQSFNSANYCLNAASSQQRMLTGVTSFRIMRQAYAWLHMIQDATDDVEHIQVRTYDNANNLLGSYKLDNALNTVSGYTNIFLRVPIGAGNISMNTITVESGSAPIITNNVAYYKVRAKDGAGNVSSTEYTYTLLDNECMYQPYHLLFMNRLGGFDTVSFSKVSRVTVTAERERYRKIHYNFTGGTFNYGLDDRGLTTFDVKQKEVVTLNSDWLTDAEFVWLQDLITSPTVFSIENGALIPVEVNTNTFEVRKSANDGASQLTIDIEYSYNEYNSR